MYHPFVHLHIILNLLQMGRNPANVENVHVNTERTMSIFDSSLNTTSHQIMRILLVSIRNL